MALKNSILLAVVLYKIRPCAGDGSWSRSVAVMRGKSKPVVAADISSAADWSGDAPVAFMAIPVLT